MVELLANVAVIVEQEANEAYGTESDSIQNSNVSNAPFVSKFPRGCSRAAAGTAKGMTSHHEESLGPALL